MSERFDPHRILQVLSDLGIQHSEPDSRGVVRCRCIHPHHEDKKPSASFFLYDGKFNCFQCGATNIYKVVQIYKNCTYKEAIDYVNDDIEINATISNINISSTPLKKEREKRDFKFNILFHFDPNLYNYTKDRGFTEDFCKRFNIRYCADGWMETANDKRISLSGYIILPLANGAWEARKVAGDDWRPKILYPTGYVINDTLFNLENLDFDSDLVIVEGSGSLPKIYNNITTNVTCTFGSIITGEQKEILQKFTKKKIFLCDWDEASFKALFDINEFLTNVWVFKERTDDKFPDFINKLKEGIIPVSELIVDITYAGGKYEG